MNVIKFFFKFLFLIIVMVIAAKLSFVILSFLLSGLTLLLAVSAVTVGTLFVLDKSVTKINK
jgi:hypothetical protein